MGDWIVKPLAKGHDRAEFSCGHASLDDFLSMQPTGPVARSMTRVSKFIQRDPKDGVASSQRTEVYLGYDNKHIYFVFVCFDQPRQTRARLSRREDIFDDDTVEVMLDTFHDERRAYVFQANALGVQWDGTYSEQGQGDLGNFDSSWDTVWDSKGKVTNRGFVVWMAIPFKSLRFPATKQQEWGMILYRGITRKTEDSFWPHVSYKVEGRLGQAGDAQDLLDPLEQGLRDEGLVAPVVLDALEDHLADVVAVGQHVEHIRHMRRAGHLAPMGQNLEAPGGQLVGDAADGPLPRGVRLEGPLDERRPGACQDF